MKKIIMLASLMLVTIGLAACGKEEVAKDKEQLKIVTSFYPMYDFTKQVTQDKADVSMLIDGGVETHDYEPSAKDMAKIQDADVFIYNSNEMETWVKDVLKNIDTSKVRVIEASEGIELLSGEASHEEHGDEEDHEGHDHEHDHDHSHAYDPHVWLDPVLAKKEVETITKGLIASDEANKDVYQKNADAYTKQLDELDASYKEAFKDAKVKKFVTQHTAFSYLAHEYGLEQIAISGLSPDQEPTPKELKKIQDLVKSENIDVIYTESSASEKIAKTVADETGAQLAVLNPMESVSKKDRDSGVNYVSIMTSNLEALKLSVK